jgi:hypothetical protein
MAISQPTGLAVVVTRLSSVVLSAVVLAGLIGTGCSHGHHRATGLPAPSVVAPAAGGAAATLLGEVNRELSAMKTTHYQHNTAVDEGTGTFNYDCSGMVDYALGRVLAGDARALPTSASKRPLAGDIERYLRGAAGRSVPGWQAVARVEQLGPGDLVAWLVTEDSTTGDTGHVMVVTAAPRPNRARAGEWLVPVADSTLNPHASDSRHQGQTGLGTGTIGLVVDSTGGPTAFYWRGGISERAKPTEIALGRPI